MATFLYRFGRFAFRRRHFVTLLWVALLALASVGAAGASATSNSSLSIPGTEAQKAFDLLEERFPGTRADGATARVVFKAPAGEKITDAGHKATVQQSVEKLSEGAEVAGATDPYQGGGVSQDGTIAYSSVSYKVSVVELQESSRDALKSVAGDARDAGLTVEMGGDALLATVPPPVGPRSSESASPRWPWSSPSGRCSRPVCRCSPRSSASESASRASPRWPAPSTSAPPPPPWP